MYCYVATRLGLKKKQKLTLGVRRKFAKNVYRMVQSPS